MEDTTAFNPRDMRGMYNLIFKDTARWSNYALPHLSISDEPRLGTN